MADEEQGYQHLQYRGENYKVKANSLEEAEAKLRARLETPESHLVLQEPPSWATKTRDFAMDTYPGRALVEGTAGAAMGVGGGPVGVAIGAVGGAAGGIAGKALEDAGAGVGGQMVGGGVADAAASIAAGRAGIARGLARLMGLNALPSRVQAMQILRTLPLHGDESAETVMRLLLERYPQLRQAESAAYRQVEDIAHGRYAAPFSPVRNAAEEGAVTLDIGGDVPGVMRSAMNEPEDAVPFEVLDRYRRVINEGRTKAHAAGAGETAIELRKMRDAVTESYRATADAYDDPLLIDAIEEALGSTAAKHSAFPKEGPEFKYTGLHPKPSMEITEPWKWGARVFTEKNAASVIRRIRATLGPDNPQSEAALRAMALDFVVERRVGAGVEGALNANAMLGKLRANENALREALGHTEYQNLSDLLTRMQDRTRPSGVRYNSEMPGAKMGGGSVMQALGIAALGGMGLQVGGAGGGSVAAIAGIAGVGAMMRRLAMRWGPNAADNFALEAALRPEFRRMLEDAAARGVAWENSRHIVRYAVRRGILSNQDILSSMSQEDNEGVVHVPQDDGVIDVQSRLGEQ